MRRGSRGLHLDYAALHARYIAGESGVAIAREVGIDFTGLYASWKRRGFPIRSTRDAARLLHQQRPDLGQNIRIATAARRGTHDTLATREQRAQTREAKGIGVSDHEVRLADRLAAEGIAFRQQAAIGPYNVDFAIGTLALDIDGGGHNPRVARNRAARHAFIETQGWEHRHIHIRQQDWIENAVEAAHRAASRI